MLKIKMISITKSLTDLIYLFTLSLFGHTAYASICIMLEKHYTTLYMFGIKAESTGELFFCLVLSTLIIICVLTLLIKNWTEKHNKKYHASTLIIVLGICSILFCFRLKEERNQRWFDYPKVDSENTWQHPATRIAGNMFGWYETGIGVQEASRRANLAFKQVNYFYYLGIINIILGSALLIHTKKKN